MHIDDGVSVVHALTTHKAVQAAARWGLEKKATGTTWVKVPMSYIPRAGDDLRIAFPSQQQSHAGDGLAKLLTTLLSSLKRRPRASTGNRTRRK